MCKRQYATYARNDTHDFTLNAAPGLQTVLTRLEYLNTHLRMVTRAPTPLSVRSMPAVNCLLYLQRCFTRTRRWTCWSDRAALSSPGNPQIGVVETGKGADHSFYQTLALQAVLAT